MGCIGSKERRWRAYAAKDDNGGFDQIDKLEEADKAQLPPAQAADQAVKQPACGNIGNIPRPKLDPKDFQFVQCKGEAKIKMPGSINGQSFMIDKCENCDIYILDHCAQVTIDECTDCRIYIGPTDGSVFLRDSSNCNVATVCRQLRTRDCMSCNIALYCRTKPIVESSSDLGFSCLDMSYPQLQEHMRQAKLSPFHNFWSDVFDFTPKEGNWRLLPPATSTASLLQPSRVAEVSELLLPLRTTGPGAQPPVGELAQGQQQQSPLLLTTGVKQPATAATPTGGGDGLSYMFVMFESTKQEQAMQLARTASEKGWLFRTNAAPLTAAAAAALAAEAGWSRAVAKKLSTAGGTGLELFIPPGPGGGGPPAADGREDHRGLQPPPPHVDADVDADVEALVRRLGGWISRKEAAGQVFRTAGLDG